jgi:hypothetical protein
MATSASEAVTDVVPTDDQPATDRPHAAILDLLAGPGRLPERTVFVEVGYSTAACRRLLSELEARGAVVRRETGTRTMVCLPDAAPTTGR